MRRVIAKQEGDWRGMHVLHVRSYLWAWLKLPGWFPAGLANWTPYSITVECQPGKVWAGLCRLKYRTVTDFLATWDIADVDTWQVRCPFIKEPIGFGEIFRSFAERFPGWFKGLFSYCEDRRLWLNMYGELRPWREQTDG